MCGGEVARRGPLGRPPEYCSDDCRETRKLLWRFAAHLGKVQPRLSEAARRNLRAEVWRALNAHLNVRRVASLPKDASVVATVAASE